MGQSAIERQKTFVTEISSLLESVYKGCPDSDRDEAMTDLGYKIISISYLNQSEIDKQNIFFEEMKGKILLNADEIVRAIVGSRQLL